MLFHEVGCKRLAEAVPAQFWRHFETRLSRCCYDDMQIVPHGLVGDALAAFCQEERWIGLGIGEVRANTFFVDAHCILGKRREDRLAYPLARALCPFPIPGLIAIALVKEIAMGSQGIQVAD